MKTAFLKLVRVEDEESEGTFGVLTVNSEAFCVTLEPPDFGNVVRRSSIPAGQYTCSKYKSPKYGLTWIINNIPNRSYVLFHGGNIVEHTKGCILIAQYFGKLKGDRAVLNSGATFKSFLNILNKYDRLHLTISEAY